MSLESNHPEIAEELDKHADKTDARIARKLKKQMDAGLALVQQARESLEKRRGKRWADVDWDVRNLDRIEYMIRKLKYVTPYQRRMLDAYINPRDDGGRAWKYPGGRLIDRHAPGYAHQHGKTTAPIRDKPIGNEDEVDVDETRPRLVTSPLGDRD